MQLGPVGQDDFVAAFQFNIHFQRRLLNKAFELVRLAPGCRQKDLVTLIRVTPLASRVMRRDYGSLLPDLIDSPQNQTTRLQCMSAAVIALTRWEPRIALNTIDIRWLKDGRAEAELSGTITETMQPAQRTIPLRGGNNANR